MRKGKSYNSHSANSILKRRRYAAKVMVKRVFRGDKDVQGRNVVVEGLGNLNFCVSRPRLQDTRIFLVTNLRFEDYTLGESTIPHFRLRSSLLRPTLANLKVLWSLDQLYKNAGKNINPMTDESITKFLLT